MNLNKKNILITGAAGFIGYALIKQLLKSGNDIRITALDNINDYYDVRLKYGRLMDLGIMAEEAEMPKEITAEAMHAIPVIPFDTALNSTRYNDLCFYRMNLENKKEIQQLFEKHSFDMVVHLAAQAGVRYSIDNPYAYLDSNLSGFGNILEGCRQAEVEHFVYASSSSVYGNNSKMPYSTADRVDHPVSLYAATKKANELMAHTYSHLYDIPVTGLRFFTVYGPWGRPDMAYFKFIKKIKAGQAIDVYNYGNLARDFTYIDDIVEGIIRVMQHIPEKASDATDASRSSLAPYKVYNIGNSRPVKLLDFIEAIENTIGQKAEKNMMPMQPGDVNTTWADTSDLEMDVGYKPNTPIREGMQYFVDWYQAFYD